MNATLAYSFGKILKILIALAPLSETIILIVIAITLIKIYNKM